MSKEYEIVRLYYEGLTQREICTALSCGHDRVSRVLKAAKAAGVDREAAETLEVYMVPDPYIYSCGNSLFIHRSSA